MIRHVVLLRWRPGVEQPTTTAALHDLQALVRSLPGVVAAYAQWNAGLTTMAFDAALTADFTDVDRWRAYQEHPEHKEFVAERLAPLLADRAVIQIQLSSDDPA